jgi:hypothetical protein
MCNLVPLDFEQQTAIANLQQPSGLTAIPACAPKRLLDRLNLGPSSQNSQREIILIVMGCCMVGLCRRFSLALRFVGSPCNGLVEVFHRKFTNRTFTRGRVRYEKKGVKMRPVAAIFSRCQSLRRSPMLPPDTRARAFAS